jgi:LPS-assembly protein
MDCRLCLCVSPCVFWLVLVVLLLSTPPSAFSARATKQSGGIEKPSAAQPLRITSDRLEYDRARDSYEAIGSVVIVQGTKRLTADRVTIRMLSGVVAAKGGVHLKDVGSDVWAEEIELNLNTDAGVVTNGKVYVKESNTLLTGRLLQRFSEDHYRIKNGSFTNCDAKDGEIPAWRFTFKDLDMDVGDRLFANSVWFCVNDQPVVPLPLMVFPIQTDRKSGFLIPEDGYDSRFGLHLRQGYFWAINPSQDLTITPDYLSNRGYGGDLQYRYAIDKNSKGQWLVTFIEDTKVGRGRALVTGTHTQQINPDLSIRAQANLLSDSTYYSDLANSGVLRALPSQESNLNITQRLSTGNAYLLGQYLQPLQVGGSQTFQRLPEIGHRLANVAPFGGPVLLSMDTTGVNFFRSQGFGYNRLDLLPTLSTDALNVGHVIGLTPSFKPRMTYYTMSVLPNGTGSDKEAHRETFWAALEATSRLNRRVSLGEGHSLMHSIEPSVIYEYVPPTNQSDIIQVDDVDDLRKKNLVTYMLRSRLLEHGGKGPTNNLVDITIAQSWHVGATPNQGRQFLIAGDPNFNTVVQSLQPPQQAVVTKKFSDIWTRAVFGNPAGFMPAQKELKLTVDSFLDPYQIGFSQFNTDLRLQDENRWYVEVGQRFTRGGNRVRRGDIWNTISFNEVFAPTPEVNFSTVAGAVKLPLGWTVGARSYYDLKNGGSPETDVVALYQNPCKCWSLGLYYLKFPDRSNYNFMISLTGLGATESFGTQVVKTILSPILLGEKAVPWPTAYVRPKTTAPTQDSTTGVTTP